MKELDDEDDDLYLMKSEIMRMNMELIAMRTKMMKVQTGFFLFGQSKIPGLFQVFLRFVELFQGLGKKENLRYIPLSNTETPIFLQCFLQLTQSDLP